MEHYIYGIYIGFTPIKSSLTIQLHKSGIYRVHLSNMDVAEHIHKTCHLCKIVSNNNEGIRCASCVTIMHINCIISKDPEIDLAFLLKVQTSKFAKILCWSCQTEMDANAVRKTEQNLENEAGDNVNGNEIREKMENGIRGGKSGIINTQTESDVEIVPNIARYTVKQNPTGPPVWMKKNSDTVQKGKNTQSSNIKDERRNQIQICYPYLNGQCRLREGECIYTHPRLCKQHQWEGKCNRAEQCQEYHARLCNTFMKYGNCKYGFDCHFHHVKCKRYSEAQGQSDYWRGSNQRSTWNGNQNGRRVNYASDINQAGQGPSQRKSGNHMGIYHRKNHDYFNPASGDYNPRQQSQADNMAENSWQGWGLGGEEKDKYFLEIQREINSVLMKIFQHRDRTGPLYRDQFDH